MEGEVQEKKIPDVSAAMQPEIKNRSEKGFKAASGAGYKEIEDYL